MDPSILLSDAGAGRANTKDARQCHPSVVPEALANDRCMESNVEDAVSSGRDAVDACGLAINMKSYCILLTLILF